VDRDIGLGGDALGQRASSAIRSNAGLRPQARATA